MDTAFQFKEIAPDKIGTGRLNSILNYWERQKGDQFAPAWGRDFRLEDIGWDLIPNMAVVDIIDGGNDYKYRFWGTNNVKCKGFEMTGKFLSESPLKVSIPIGREQFGRTILHREPLAFLYVGEYLKHVPTGQISCRFPLSSDGEAVDKIVTYYDFDSKHDDWDCLYTELWDGHRPDQKDSSTFRS